MDKPMDVCGHQIDAVHNAYAAYEERIAYLERELSEVRVAATAAVTRWVVAPHNITAAMNALGDTLSRLSAERSAHNG